MKIIMTPYELDNILYGGFPSNDIKTKEDMINVLTEKVNDLDNTYNELLEMNMDDFAYSLGDIMNLTNAIINSIKEN